MLPGAVFQYFNKGNLATIGRAKAIADFGRVHLTGFVAWIVWLFVHILNLVGFRNRVSVLLQWAYAYFTYQRGMRLITGVDVEATRARAGCASRPPIGPFTQRERSVVMSETHRTRVSNVLVVGSGAAGLRAAIAVHAAGREVVIVGKRLRKDAHTVLAAGGINAALGTVDPEDWWQHHFADTVIEGHYLGNPRAVEIHDP